MSSQAFQASDLRPRPMIWIKDRDGKTQKPTRVPVVFLRMGKHKAVVKIVTSEGELLKLIKPNHLEEFPDDSA